MSGSLPDLSPFTGAAVYRTAAEPSAAGGDWYDAVVLPDRAYAAVIGDVVGHDLNAAAMAQARNMLRALLYDSKTPPSSVLTQLDHIVHAITNLPVTTACLARIEPDADGWGLHWSTAGHLPPLVLTRGGVAYYLHGDPGVPLASTPTSTAPTTPTRCRRASPSCCSPTVSSSTPTTPSTTAWTPSPPTTPIGPWTTSCAPSQTCAPGHDDMAILAIRTPDHA